MRNTNMRRGFTMIELIFVIVIIGILAAVAIPKLAATRSDAEAAKIVNNLATCIGDAGGAYLKDEAFAAGEGSVSCTTGLSTSGGTACFTHASSDTAGTFTVTDAGAGTAACDEAHILAAANTMAGGTVHQF